MTKLVPTDVGDFFGTETLYVEMKKPRWLRYQWNKIALFFGIATWNPWRWWKPEEGDVDPITAWDVACICHNYRQDLLAWRAVK